MDWDLPKKIAAAATALVTLGGLAWAIGDDSGYRPVIKREFVGFINTEFKMAMDQAEQNTLANARQDFIYIEDKMKRGGELSWEEKRDFCKNAQILGYPAEGCLESGEPDLVKKSTDQ